MSSGMKPKVFDRVLSRVSAHTHTHTIGHVFTPQWWQMRSACPHDYSPTAVLPWHFHTRRAQPSERKRAGLQKVTDAGAQPRFHRQTGDFTEDGGREDRCEAAG